MRREEQSEEWQGIKRKKRWERSGNEVRGERKAKGV